MCSCQSVCPPVCLYVCTWHVRALAARFFLQQDASTPASTPPSPVCTGVFACNAPARKARAHTSLLPHARAHTKMVLVERWGASRRETPGSVVLRARHTARRARGQVPSLALSAAICIFCFPPLLFLIIIASSLPLVGCDRNRMPILSKASNVVQNVSFLYDVTGFTQIGHSTFQVR